MSRTLTQKGEIRFFAIYKQTDILTNPTNLIDRPNYKFEPNLLSGVGTNKANRFYHDRLEGSGAGGIVINLLSVIDSFGEVVTFETLKTVVFHNRSVDAYVLVTHAKPDGTSFQFNMGPGGRRFLFNPLGEGIEISESEEEVDEGTITIIGHDITKPIIMDAFLIGTTEETSSGA